MSILDSILDVFTDVGTWLITAVSQMMAIFYTADGGLTLLGTLAVCGLSFAVIFLVIGVIQNFLRFRS